MIWRSGWTAGLALVLAMPSAHADGIPAYIDRTGWHLLEENEQHAVVALHGGRESLLLLVKVERGADAADAERLAWVVPVPARARDVKADILLGFPEFFGSHPELALASMIRTALAAMAATQIYTLPVLAGLVMLRGGSASSGAGVTVEQRLVRHGVEIQVLAAESPEALAAHLRGLEIGLPAPAIRSLGAYARPDASFLVQRIADLPAYLRATSAPSSGHSTTPLAVSIDFPSRQGFFPLAASSALPGGSVEIVVTAVGFVTPVDPVPAGVETAWFLGSAQASPEATRALGVPLTGRYEQRYTRMRLVTRPAALEGDLRFRPGAPAVTELAASFLSRPATGPGTVTGFFLGLALLSATAALGARRAWPAAARPSRLACAALGLANCLTVLGLLVASLVRARRASARKLDAVWFTIATSLLFCGLLLLLAAATLAV